MIDIRLEDEWIMNIKCKLAYYRKCNQDPMKCNQITCVYHKYHLKEYIEEYLELDKMDDTKKVNQGDDNWKYKELPKDKGLYWFYGNMYKGVYIDKFEMIMCNIKKDSSGNIIIIADGHFAYRSEFGEHWWFRKADIPELPKDNLEVETKYLMKKRREFQNEIKHLGLIDGEYRRKSLTKEFAEIDNKIFNNLMEIRKNKNENKINTDN